MRFLSLISNALRLKAKNLLLTRHGYALLCMNILLVVSSFNLYRQLYTLFDFFIWICRRVSRHPYNSLSINDEFSIIRYLVIAPATAALFEKCHSIRFFFSWVWMRIKKLLFTHHVHSARSHNFCTCTVFAWRCKLSLEQS